jgi:hypothetical protein
MSSVQTQENFYGQDVPKLYKNRIDEDESIESYTEKMRASVVPENQEYPELYELHRLGEHPFIQYLNKQYHYKAAVNAFCSKEIMAMQTFLHTRGSKKTITPPPLPNIFFLNEIIARCYQLSQNIEQRGISAFVDSKKTDDNSPDKYALMEKIKHLALQLIENIEGSPEADILDRSLVFTLNDSVDQIEFYKKLRPIDKFQNQDYELYFVSRNHEKAKRQVLCNFLVHQYAEVFVVKTKTYTKKVSSLNGVRYNRTKSFTNIEVPTPYKPDPTKRWERRRGFINADVLIEIIALVNGDDNLDTRQIQRARQQLYKSIDST